MEAEDREAEDDVGGRDRRPGGGEGLDTHSEISQVIDLPRIGRIFD